MSLFAKPTLAPRPKTKNIRTVSLVLAAAILVLVVAQLFTFERFPDTLVQMNLPWDERVIKIQAALIVTLEVGALPFLLFMSLSRVARVGSMLAGWVVVAWWLCASLWANLTQPELVNGGLLGATIELPVGWWMVFFSLALAVLATWTAWGMWPLDQKSKE